MSESRNVLYLNGLERTQVGIPEKLAARYLARKGVGIDFASVDWHSGAPFHELLEDVTQKAQQKMRHSGRLAIVGASAGGSLGVNLFQRLRADNPSTRVSLITLSGRLRVDNPEHLEYTALHRPGKKPSPAFIDSVLHCDKNAIPQLAETDKLWIRTVRPRADQTVPVSTMSIDGVPEYSVPIRGHVPGIALGLLRVPEIIDDIYSE